MTRLRELYLGRRVVVCVGTGGVGKTTVAASLALAAAGEGRRVLVMTIDPSLRLAQALGIDLSKGAHVAAATPIGTAGGSLTAQVLDVQATFDNIIRTRASSEAQAEAILRNRIYRHFSASMAGSHEYAAVEALWDASNDARYDLVVLDTPPSQHAVDFLEAPERILQFLSGNGLVERVPGGSAAKGLTRRLFDLGGSLVTRTVGKISGAETLQDVLSFLHALTDMYDSFKARAEGVGTLLRQPDVAFLLVGAPTPAQLAALGHFVGELTAHGIAPNGFVLNRMRPDPRATGRDDASLGREDGGQAMAEGGAGRAHDAGAAPRSKIGVDANDDAAADAAYWAALDEAVAQQQLGAEVREELHQALREELARAGRDASYLAQLRQTVAPLPVWALEEMPVDADSRRGLTRLAQML